MDALKIPSEQLKGIGLIIGGSVLLLHQIGLLPQRLDFYIIIFAALYLIFLGMVKLDAVKKLQIILSKKKN